MCETQWTPCMWGVNVVLQQLGHPTRTSLHTTNKKLNIRSLKQNFQYLKLEDNDGGWKEGNKVKNLEGEGLATQTWKTTAQSIPKLTNIFFMLSLLPPPP